MSLGEMMSSSILEEGETILDLNNSMVQRAYKRELNDQSKCQLLKTIVSYVVKDIKTKTRSFCIGVMTVFLVVSFITSLKSQVDILPIALLKTGQDQGGTIDFQLTANADNMLISGDHNLYQDPFPPNKTQDI